MMRLGHAAMALALALYPFAVSYSLQRGGIGAVAAALIGLGLLRLLSRSGGALWPLGALAIVCGALALLLKDPQWLKFYPVCMSLGALAIFAATLWRPPSLIERIARLHEPDLPPAGVAWTRRVTQVWCGFFIGNALIAAWTVCAGSEQQWLWYNGFISYCLMALLLGGEFALRHYHRKRHAL